jgi:hypothetical protein
MSFYFFVPFVLTDRHQNTIFIVGRLRRPTPKITLGPKFNCNVTLLSLSSIERQIFLHLTGTLLSLSLCYSSFPSALSFVRHHGCRRLHLLATRHRRPCQAQISGRRYAPLHPFPPHKCAAHGDLTHRTLCRPRWNTTTSATSPM